MAYILLSLLLFHFEVFHLSLSLSLNLFLSNDCTFNHDVCYSFPQKTNIIFYLHCLQCLNKKKGHVRVRMYGNKSLVVYLCVFCIMIFLYMVKRMMVRSTYRACAVATALENYGTYGTTMQTTITNHFVRARAASALLLELHQQYTSCLQYESNRIISIH